MALLHCFGLTDIVKKTCGSLHHMQKSVPLNKMCYLEKIITDE